MIEEVVEDFEQQLKDAVAEENEGKRKCEASWKIHRIHWEKNRFIYDLMYVRKVMSRELVSRGWDVSVRAGGQGQGCQHAGWWSCRCLLWAVVLLLPKLTYVQRLLELVTVRAAAGVFTAGWHRVCWMEVGYARWCWHGCCVAAVARHPAGHPQQLRG
jgi:hypothetical protein